MAMYFSAEWKDITVAIPVNILEIDTINQLARTIQLNILVENTDAVEFLEHHLEHPVGVFLKVDVGYGRAGIPAANYEQMDSVLKHLKQSRNMTFLGFLSHAGHTYSCRSKESVRNIHQETNRLMKQLKERYIESFPKLQLSIGDTPSCSIVDPEDLALYDEIRPGNFVFYDVEQSSVGSCELRDIAVAVACPIVAKHADRNELVLYGGAVHCSKDRLNGEPEGTIYGRIGARVGNDSLDWHGVMEGAYVRSLSQEHGIVVVPNTIDFEQFKVGDLVLILPVHSCMAADVLKHNGYLTTDGTHLERMKN